MCPAQWTDATRKNYYAKYSTRLLLVLGLLLNLVVLPGVLTNLADRDRFASEDMAVANEDEDGKVYFKQVQMAMVRKAAHETRRAHSPLPTAAALSL